VKVKKSHHKDGTVEANRYYDEGGNQIAIEAFYNNGQMAYSYKLKGGKKYGICKYWTFSGELMWEKLFRDDEEIYPPDGTAFLWDTQEKEYEMVID
jgi:antitoxin component YwqK of YwqJK toxin-antitoxin module